MKRLMPILAIFLAFQAQAEIYKCKDGDGKLSYQDTPCASGMVGKIKKAPEVSEEEKIRARTNLDKMINQSKNADVAIETEWRQKQEHIRKVEEQEALARQQQAERARQYLKDQEAREKENQNRRLLERQTAATEQAAKAAEEANRRRINCRPDLLGGFICN